MAYVNGVSEAYPELIRQAFGSDAAAIKAINRAGEFKKIFGMEATEPLLSALYAGEIKVTNDDTGRRKLEYLAETLVQHEVHQVFDNKILVPAPNGKPKQGKCKYCKRLDSVSNLTEVRKSKYPAYYHKRCEKEYRRAKRMADPTKKLKKFVDVMHEDEVFSVDGLVTHFKTTRKVIVDIIDQTGVAIGTDKSSPFRYLSTGQILLTRDGMRLFVEQLENGNPFR